MDSDIEMAREAKDLPDATMSLVRDLDALSLGQRLSVMRNTAGALSPQDQLRTLAP